MALIDLGKPFSLKQNDISDDRFNAKMNSIDTASNLFNMTTKIPGQVMIPTTSGNGMTKNVPVFRSVDDANTLIPLGLTSHTHAQYTANEGGALADILFYNIGNVFAFLSNTWMKANFWSDASGAGSSVADEINSDVGELHLESGTTSGGYANIRVLGTQQDLAYNSIFMTRCSINGPFTTYLLKFGVNCEHISEANSNSRKSYGWEACSANANWQAFSCDGTTRSTTSASYAVDGADDVFEAQHYPGDPDIQFKRNHNSGTTITKANNIPTSGSTVSSRTWQMGITSTAASATRVMHYKGTVLFATQGTSDWQWFVF
jgi:hypothetical protein